MKQVLILEDDVIQQKLIREMVNGKVELLQAYNLKEAETLFETHKKTLDLIALDGNVPLSGSTFPNTVELARHIRSQFHKALYSLTGNNSIRDDFKKIGFDGILGMKFEIIQIILSLQATEGKITH